MRQLLILLLGITMQVSAQVSSTETAVPMAADKTYRSTEVDVKPQVKDGNYTLSMFISENFKFPPAVKNKKVTIFSSFIIDEQGNMSEIKAFHVAVKDYLPTAAVKISTQDEKIEQADQVEMMKAETVRVLKLFNKTWQPAQKGGQPVRCLYNYPINFNIE